MKSSNNKFVDSSDVKSLDVNLRKLYDASGNEVLDWNSPAFQSDPGFGTTRIVYLVQDAADATALGSSGNNVYTTFQAAYTAANTIQQALGGTNKVAIMVGNTTAASVGDLTLTAAWNGLVSIIGISPQVSELGNIIATNASGNGYNVGTIIGSTNQLRTVNVKIGNITTSPTGATGGGGSIVIVAFNCAFGNLVTSCPNTTNTNGGRVQFTAVGNNSSAGSMSYVASIDTSVNINSTLASGSIALLGGMTVGTIISMDSTNVSAGAGTFSVSGNGIGGYTTISSLKWYNALASGNGVNISNANINSLTMQTLASNGLTLTDSVVSSLTINGLGVSNITRCRIGGYTSETSLKATIKDSFVGSIWGIGDDSLLMNVTLDGSNGTGNAIIDEIGNNCTLVGVNMNTTSPSTVKAIDSPTPVNVNVDNATFNSVVGDTITLYYKGGCPEIVEDGLGNFVYNADKSESAYMSLIGSNAGSNTLTFRGVAIGRTYRILVSNTTGADTLSFVGPSGVYFANGTPYVPTASAGATDLLEIFVGVAGDLYVKSTPAFA